MLATKGKIPHDSRPDVKKEEKAKKPKKALNKTDSPAALFLFYNILSLTS